MNSPVRLNNTRRNLFGIRLNQEQLKTDLTSIWKEQVDRQARRWNFDFESLRPLDSEGSFLMHSSPIRTLKRFEWTQVGCSGGHRASQRFYSGHVMTAFDQSEVDFEEYDEEYDEALAIPAFYQYQRVQKMEHEQARLKKVRMETIAKIKANTQSTQVVLPSAVTKKPKVQKVNKNKVAKVTSTKASLTPGLIITFSENRKDTLRSATAGNCNSDTNNNKDNKTKQPTILNLLKQRKQVRVNNAGGKQMGSKEN